MFVSLWYQNKNTMEMNLVDGLGYDSVKEQYFTVTYAWKNIVPNQKKSKTTIGKSGITRYDVKTAMSEAVPTRGRQFHQEALWGYECDRKYLPKDISEKDANKIVQTMDSLFKESMLDWTYRNKKQSKEIGTEFYEGPTNEWLDRIKEEWASAFGAAIMRVLGYDYNFNISMVQAMGNQGTVTEQIGEVLEENNKVRSIIPCGYGKSFIMWYGIHKWKPFKDKKFIIYYCHNIPATKQLAVKHSQYSNGGDGFKRVVVCSEKKYVNGQVKYGIENYSASESKLSEVLEESFKSPERVIFYVNNRSAGEFQEKFKSISKKLRLTINPGAIVDEAQEFTGHKDTDKVDAIVRSISDYQVSFTATERRRGTDTNRDRIYNDDEQYFGVVATEITVSQTISEGRSCPIHFKTVEVSDNHTLMTEIQRNNIVETIFNDETTLSVRGRMLRSVVCLVKSIKEDERTHPMVVTSLIVNTHSFIRLITKLQELDIIPKDYVIVRGLRTDGINSAVEFNNHKKAIFVGTPWMVTGTDAPNTDGLIADYDMGSEITGSQWIGRGQRPVDDKELMVYIPTNPDTTEISTLLRVANKYIQDENVHIEAEETNVEERDDVLGSVQRRNITTQIDRDINANPSLKVYWDKVYEDLTTNVIGRTGDYLRSRLTTEYIEDWYKQFENKSLKEMNESGNKHISGKAREIGIHNDLMEKYNIKRDKYFGEKDYSVLLTCKNNTEAKEKYNAEFQSLWKTKDNNLIQQYTGHFVNLRVRGYSEEMLNDFFNSLSSDEYPDDQRGNKDFNGKYRAIFNRGKEQWYDRISNKWGNKVPRLFLNEDDKIKRVEEEMELCKIDGKYDFTFWYDNYKSSHQGVLKRNNRLDLVEKFNETKKHSRQFTKEDLIKKLNPFKGMIPQRFRDQYPSECQWLYDRPELKSELFTLCGLIEDPKWTKRKNGNINEKTIVEIKKLLKGGYTHRVLAEKFNTSTHTISIIRKQLQHETNNR